MEHEDQKHEIVRFRREDIAHLDSFPSAAEGKAPVAGPGWRFGAGRVLIVAAVLLIGVLVAVPSFLFVFGVPRMAQDRLRDQAEAVLSRMAGVPLVAALGEPKLSIDKSRFLGLQVDDVTISSAETGQPILEAGTLKFGLRTLPMLSGKLQLGSAGIEDARLVVAALPSRTGPGWLSGLKGPDGLIEPELAVRAVFDALHRAFAGLDMGSTRSVELTNIRVVFPDESKLGVLTLENGLVERMDGGGLRFEATADADGRRFALEGESVRDGLTARIASFTAKLTAEDIELFRPKTPPPSTRPLAVTGVSGGLTLTVDGAETAQGPPRLGLRADVANLRIGYVNGDQVVANGRLDAAVDTAGRKIEFAPSQLYVGRSRFAVHGALGPSPTVVAGKPVYRFELVSDGSMVAQGGSNEPDLPIFARIAGHIDRDTGRIGATDMGLRTDRGQVFGSAVVNFAAGKAPGLDLALSVPEMPVGYAKQIWPWFAANGAWNWANANLFGGTLRNSTLSLSIAPGRIGDGVPLNANEITGRFEVQGTRFDVSGEIPPVRDGVGTVDIRGTDVDIRLDTGTIYLPTGRTVAASNGKFDIRRNAKPPITGDLDIAVSGSADAISELATYKPIDALRHLPVLPDDLSGDMAGQVKARIPLQKGFDFERTWSVALTYQNLSIAKPIEGQMVSDAAGAIDVNPAMAVVEAKARLNGMPATLSIREPLGEDKSARRRDVALQLDDKARNALAPALSSILSGTISVRLEGEGSTREVTADLGDARLSVPWMGWSKGPGVPAKLSFTAVGEGGDMRISDLKLDGKSFSLAGSATIDNGVLTEARFGNVRLNRNDDISVQVKKSGNGYSVSVRGEVLDARSLIKQALKDGTPDEAAGEVRGGKPTPITLDASVAYVSGFGGEALNNVKIAYRGTGGRIGSLEVTASTRAGGQFTVNDGTTDDQRRVVMRSADAGAVLRFLDIYPHMRGGQIGLSLAGGEDGTLRGQIDARNFALVDEPRLRSIVSTPASNSQSLSDAVKRDIDTSRVQFDRGFAEIEKGKGYLSIQNGAIRGPLLGTTFQGTLYDRKGNMAITGTFMPAYGLNSLFAELPLLGPILGGRDRGLIGITYKVAGDAKSPTVQVNPISAIAPGIFRQIFEFN